jgi:hypothetical protein
MMLDPTPPPSSQLHHAKAFVHVGEYVRTICALAPYTCTTPLTKTIATIHHFHSLVEIDFSPFVDDFNLEMDLVLINRHLFLF